MVEILHDQLKGPVKELDAYPDHSAADDFQYRWHAPNDPHDGVVLGHMHEERTSPPSRGG
jgi:hypothetical protein